METGDPLCEQQGPPVRTAGASSVDGSFLLRECRTQRRQPQRQVLCSGGRGGCLILCHVVQRCLCGRQCFEMFISPPRIPGLSMLFEVTRPRAKEFSEIFLRLLLGVNPVVL